MNIKEHMKNNEDAKEFLLRVIKTNLAKYISGQELINKTLVDIKLPTKRPKKHKNCLYCAVSRVFKKMATCQSIVQEACKTYQLMFDEKLNLSDLIDEVSREHFDGMARQNKGFDPEDAIIPNDAPEEIRNVVETLLSKLSSRGIDGVKVEVIDIKADNYGLKQEDFADFGDFCRAVSAAREAEAEGKSGEQVLNDAIIHTAEKTAENPKPKDKLN